MGEETHYLIKHMLIHIDQYAVALEKFPNLCGLEDVDDPSRPPADPRARQSEVTSSGCGYAKVTGYQRVDWLMSPSKPTAPKKRARRPRRSWPWPRANG